MAKIYVSSTYVDLIDCRKQVSLTIRKMNHEDIAMEYYTAENKRPVDKCVADVAACDLYIGIFAWRYGWIPSRKNPKKISITEMEYRQALKSKKNCLIFLLNGDALWSANFIDRNRKQIERLRREFERKHTIASFSSKEDIGAAVAVAIHNWESSRSGPSLRPTIPKLDFTSYYNAIKKRYQKLDLDALTPPEKEEYLQLQLRSVFVEQNVRESSPPFELPKELWDRLQKDRDIVPDDLPEGVSILVDCNI